MRMNRSPAQDRTHNGAPASQVNPEEALRRSVMCCLLWEDSFYEQGQDIGARIAELVPRVSAEKVAALAIEAREEMKLRHVPLFLVREMARLPEHKKLVADTLARVIQRPDELSEFVAIYWKDKKQPLSGQVKKGLARAFQKFSEYQLAKYNRDHAIKLRDVLFLCHAKPVDAGQEETWKKLIAGTLQAPDTWEVALSAGKDKKETWERLIKEEKLGSLALLRNLRNMREANVSPALVRDAIIQMKTDRVLPYRFIGAARFAPDLEPELEKAMFKCLAASDPIAGRTILLIDVSGSMEDKVSSKSELTRLDAASGVAMLLRETCEQVNVLTFSNELAEVPPRRGFALRDAITHSQPHGGTELGKAVKTLATLDRSSVAQRIIVITDEQTSDPMPNPIWAKAYIINVAAYKNGVGYGPWTHITGWSEAVVSYIRELESSENRTNR